MAQSLLYQRHTKSLFCQKEKNMKTSAIIGSFAVIGVLLAGAGLAEAHGYYHGYHKSYAEKNYGDCYGFGRHSAENCPYGGNCFWEEKNFSAEQIAAIEKLQAKHFDTMQSLGKEFRQKQRELNTLKYNSNTDTKDLQKILADMNAIEDKMYTERQNFASAMQKEYGIELKNGYGMRRGKMHRSCY